jgi:hypothetical protein
LVAYFSVRDRWHSWGVEQMKAFTPPLLTCEPVLTEACFLIQRAGGFGGVWSLGPADLHPLALLFVLSGTLMISKTLRIPKL